MIRESCARCGNKPKKLFYSDHINTWIGRPLFPKGKMICQACIKQAIGEHRYQRLLEIKSYIALK